MTVCPFLSCIKSNLSNKVETSASYQICGYSFNTHTVKDFFLSATVATKIHHFSKDSLHKKWFHCPLIHYMKQPCQLSCKWLKVQLQATENEDPSSYPAMQKKKKVESQSCKNDLTDMIRSAMWSRIINFWPGPVKSIIPLF